MPELFVFVVFSLIVIVVLTSSLKIAEESERFAVFMLGRFQAFRGPGLVFIAPFIQIIHRIRVGDTGTLVSSEFANLAGVDVPISNPGSIRPGQAVRVDGFDGVEPRIAASSLPAKNQCPKCGHQF